MLQGTLENFALDEVLGLLASTNKTGKLEISGDRGTGSLLFSGGLLVGARANHTPNGDSTEDIMFELLRFGSGNFTFSAEQVTSMEEGRELGTVLNAAENRIADWRDIERIVPSLSHIVTPVPELPAEEVTINRQEWAALNVIGSGCPVSLVCSELDLGEVEGSRRIKELAERSLVLVGEPLSGNSTSVSSYVRTDLEETSAKEVDMDSLDSMSSYVDELTVEPLEDAPPMPDSGIEDFDGQMPPSLAEGLAMVQEESTKPKNSMLRRYLSSED